MILIQQLELSGLKASEKSNKAKGILNNDFGVGYGKLLSILSILITQISLQARGTFTLDISNEKSAILHFANV